MFQRATKALCLSIAASLGISSFAPAAQASSSHPPAVIQKQQSEESSLSSRSTYSPKDHDPTHSQVTEYGIKGFLIKEGLKVASSLLKSRKAREIVEEGRKKNILDEDMAKAIEDKPNAIADAIDKTIAEAGDYEEGITDKLTAFLRPVVGDKLALGVAKALMFVFI